MESPLGLTDNPVGSRSRSRSRSRDEQTVGEHGGMASLDPIAHGWSFAGQVVGKRTKKQ